MLEDKINQYQKNIEYHEYLIEKLLDRPISIEAKAMIDSNDNSRSIKAEGDVNISNSVVNLGEIIGDVTNKINEISDNENSQNP